MLPILFLTFLCAFAAKQCPPPSDPGPSDPLRSQRYDNLDLFMARGNSLDQLITAYTVATSDDVYRIIRSLGSFGPGGYPHGIAYEYDSSTFVVKDLLGYTPVMSTTGFDRFRSTWLEHDLLVLTRLVNSSTNWNTTRQAFDIVAEGFVSTSYIRFENSTSAKISLSYDITDPASDLLLTATSSDTAPDAICDTLIKPSCNGTDDAHPRPNWPDTGFIDAADCKAFMNAIPAAGICPFPVISNTTRCRRIHALSAFPRPDIHCPHVRRNSEVCVDSCADACSNCHPNAHCTADFPTFDTITYRCECNNGYIGNGKTVCAPKPCDNTCDSDNQFCAPNPVNGNLEICKASGTFGWDATTGGSTCDPETHSIWKQEDGTELCIPKGRCLEHKHCEAAKSRTVTCRPYGHNDYTQWEHCLCNHGYQGGLDYPCVCPDGNREVLLSGDLGKVCLSQFECTRNSHCPRNYKCNSPNRETTVGACVPK